MLKDDDEVVFLLDVDNTLLDNDRFSADLDARLQRDFGEAQRARYREIYDALRERLGFADYLGALQQFRTGLEDDPALLEMSSFMLDYPFAERVYPGAIEVVEHLRTLGTPVILSDGDAVFQPRKIQRSGLWDLVRGRVLIYLHKQRRVEAIQRRFPARHYVMVEDKPQLLASMKAQLGDRLTTVCVRQGHYATKADGGATDPPADLTIAQIGELAGFDRDRLGLERTRAGTRPASTHQETS